MLFDLRGAGGLLDAITSSNGGGDTGADRFRTQETAATAKARANPTDAAAWAAVARARFNLANAGSNIDQAAGTYTAQGKAELEAASRAWEKHVQLAGNKPDSRVASLMVQAYSALNQLDKASAAQEIIAEDRNSAGAYATLAQFAYQAGQTRKGDLAAKKALDLTDPDMRQALKGQLDAAKQQATQQGAQGSSTP